MPAQARLGSSHKTSAPRKLTTCGTAAGEAACIAACASVNPAGIAICLSNACFGPDGPDFNPNCGKDGGRRLLGAFCKASTC
mgnify:CR=1 FL=1